MLIAALCAVFSVQPAKAIVFQPSEFISSLNAGNSAILPFTGPYGTVTVDLTSLTIATVTFTSNTVNGNIYLFAVGSSAAVNVNASAFTITGISGTQPAGFGPTTYSVANPPGTSNVDGLGSFNGVIDSNDGFTAASDSITFTLTNSTATWATANDVLVNNSKGFDAAAHIFVTATPPNPAAGALATGFAGEGPQSNVPDSGTTAMLLGSALVGLGAIRRFIKH